MVKKHGKTISEVEVTNISQHGFWVLIDDSEYFLSFEKYPWFKDARISEITELEVIHNHHLHWPSLDIDLSLEILQQPDKYPLVFNDKK
ncbi:MAG: DUF2442 domain-containing protein [Planctomycetes bacterium]|nr:DUF2442 domain-containing protein [Planctomycetota bacterium]